MSRVKLGEVAIEIRETVKDPSGLPVVGLEHLLPDEMKLTVWSENSDNTFSRRFRKGQVLFGRRRAYQKKAVVATVDGVCSGDITVIAAKEDRISPDLLPFVIHNDSLFDYAMEKSAGSLSPRVKWEQLSEFEFELPDLAAQNQLASLLWAFERTKKAYKALIEKSDELVKSQFVEMFGDCIKNEMGWPSKPLMDVLAKGRTVTYGIVKMEDDIPGGVPVFRPVDISQGHIPHREELKCTSVEISQQYKRTILKGNELLITVRGSIGETFQISEEFTDCNVARNIVPLEVNSEILDQGFLKAIIDSPAFQHKLGELTKGVALKGINMNEFKMCPIILPPLDKQRECVKLLQQIDKSKLEAKQALESLDAMQKSLMRKHLGGE